MGDDARRRVEELFQQAVDLTDRRRVEFLDHACGGDTSIRAEVEALLACHEDDTAEFLERPAYTPAPGGDATGGGLIPAQFGHYRIVRPLGRGGMGEVFEAEQDHPRRTVALKIIRPGLASDSVLRRFQHEADILGRLRHVGIAQIYEAGTFDLPHGPQPYFAMEFVQGPTLLEYADGSRLGTRERLELFARICDAVQHAHHHGVIHRDLKPGNILVVEEGTQAQRHQGTKGADGAHPAQPKVLDFGVARITDADMQTVTLRTDIGQLLGTVPYMSPEQVTGEPSLMDTRSDVYSLGVILYELLAGRLPLDVRNRSIPEAARMIREDEPSRLSSINPLFRGDIDTIVAKALEKDKTRRYGSAAELASDLRRYLRDEPIIARPASAFYQLRKFAKRNRGLVAWMLIAAFLLVAGFCVALMFAVGENRQRARADIKSVEAQRLAYRASIAAAQAALRSRDFRLAESSLADAPVGLRGWEWDHVHWLCDRGALTIHAAGPMYDNLSISNDGARMLCMTNTGVLSIRDGDSGEVIRSVPTGVPDTFGAVSPDGRWVLHRDHGDTVMEEADTGRVAWRMPLDAMIHAEAFHPAGTSVAVGVRGLNRVQVLDARTGAEIGHIDSLPQSGNWSGLFSPNGEMLACMCASAIRVYSCAGWRPLTAFDAWSWRFDPLTSHIFVASTARFEEIDPVTGKTIRGLGVHYRQIPMFAARSDGALLVLGPGDGTLTFNEPDTLAELAVIPARSTNQSVFSTRDGQRLLTASTDGTIQVRDAHVQEAPLAVPRLWQDDITAATASPDGRRVVTAGWGVVSLFDTQRAEPKWRRTVSRQWLHRAVFRPDNASVTLVGADGMVAILELATGKVLMHERLAGFGDLQAAEYLADGSAVLFGSREGTLGVISISEANFDSGRSVGPGPVRKVLGDDRAFGAINAMARSPDGRWIAVATGQRPRVVDVGAAPLAGIENAIALVDATSLVCAKVLTGHTQPVTCVAFSPDGAYLVSGSADRGVILWRVDDGLRAAEFIGATDRIRCITFSPDGSRMCAGCDDASIHLWDVATGDRVVVLGSPHGQVMDLRFTPNGRTLLASCDAAHVVAYETGPPMDGYEHRERIFRAWRVIQRWYESFVSAGQMAADVPSLSDAIAAGIRGDSRISEPVRAMALELLATAGEHVNWLNSDAWGLAKAPGRSAEDYARALGKARRADALLPDDPGILNTLGTAEYRAGRYADAIVSLNRSDEGYVRRGDAQQAANWLMIAMAQHQLGHVQEAADALAKAKELAGRLTEPDTDIASFLEEAEALIKPPTER